MRAVNHTWLIIVVWALWWLSCSSPVKKGDVEDQPYVDQLTLSLDSIGQEVMSLKQVMALSIAVAKEGDIIYEKGFGFIDSAQTQMTGPESIFLLASISKLVGATMTMKLVEE